MYLDFHTHGKLAKHLPFSTEYTDWLVEEAKNANLDGICLTEHFNTLHFKELYQYIESTCRHVDDTLVCQNGLHIFPGMEVDIAEGGHVLVIGDLDTILLLNRHLEPNKSKDNFLSFAQLLTLLKQYPLLIGAGHPFRQGGHIPEQPDNLLQLLDFLDLNAKDLAHDRDLTQKAVQELSRHLNLPAVGGSDTHQALQYGSIRTKLNSHCTSISSLKKLVAAGEYSITIHPEVSFQVHAANLLKHTLKTIHALGGDYVSALRF